MAIQEREPQIQQANKIDIAYQNLLRDILQNGTQSIDRTGTGTLRVSGRILKADLSEGFPLLTTKNVWFKGVKEELLWFIRGERNIRNLVLAGVHIWDEWPFQKFLEKNEIDDIFPKNSPEWEKRKNTFIEQVKNDEKFAQEWGDLGPVYGYQWRHWKTRDGGEIDQLTKAIQTIKNRPSDRRILVTAWNPEDVDRCALPPCHYAFQFQVIGNKLNCMMDQRSVDTFLGLPFNIASYGLLTEIVAKITNLEPGDLTLFLGDTHLYLNHIDQAKEQLQRTPRTLPRIELGNISNLDDIKSEEIKLVGYNPHPKIEAQISV